MELEKVNAYFRKFNASTIRLDEIWIHGNVTKTGALSYSGEISSKNKEKVKKVLVPDKKEN